MKSFALVIFGAIAATAFIIQLKVTLPLLPSSGGSANNPGSTLTIGDVTFTQSGNRLFALAPSAYGLAGLTSDFLNNNSGGSQFLIEFANPVYGFAADICSIYNWGNTPTPTIIFGFGSSSHSVTLVFPGDPGRT